MNPTSRPGSSQGGGANDPSTSNGVHSDDHKTSLQGQQPNGTAAAPTTQSAAPAAHATAAHLPPPPHEPTLPTRKDVSLREFLSHIDDYTPLIPDAVTHYYMTKAGLPPPPQTDQRLARLLALATQKFISDVAADAYQYSRIRASSSNNNSMNLGPGAAAAMGVGGAGAAAAGPGAATGAGVPGTGATATGGAGAKDSKNGALGLQRPGYGGGGQGGNQNRAVLTMEDLGMALGEYGVNVKRGEFYR